MESTIMQLVLLMNILPADDAEHHLAAQILKNFFEIPNLSIEEMAERCFTSTATLSRFCKRLGFRNYFVFRNTFDPEIQLLKKDRPVYCGYSYLPEASPVERFVGQTIDSLMNIQRHLDLVELDAAVSAFHQAEHILLVGNSSMMPAIIDFQYRMLLCERFVGYSATWVHASEMEYNSVRVLPEIVHARGKDSNGQVEISTVERLSPQDGNLIDIHISVHESVPFVTSDRRRFSNDGETGKVALMCTLGILHSAYSEKYIRELVH